MNVSQIYDRESEPNDESEPVELRMELAQLNAAQCLRRSVNSKI
jgi:hypothetical protein